MPRLFTALELPERIVSQLAVARGGLVGARWLEAGGLPHHAALHRRRRRAGGARHRRDARRHPPADGAGPIRGLELVRRRQAAGHHRQGEVRPGADGSAGRAGAAPETHRRRAGDAQVYAACDAGAAARRRSGRCRRLSRRPRRASGGGVHRRALRALFGPRRDGRRDPMSSRPPIRWARLRATKSKPSATKSKSSATKSKSGATKSKPPATKSKCVFRPRIESFQ